METEKTRYSDEELEEFRTIINEKLALAKRDYDQMMAAITNQDSNDVDDTSPTYKALEEGSATQSKEEIITMAPTTTIAASQPSDRNRFCPFTSFPSFSTQH